MDFVLDTSVVLLLFVVCIVACIQPTKFGLWTAPFDRLFHFLQSLLSSCGIYRACRVTRASGLEAHDI